MIARLRIRLNDLERRRPIAFAAVVILACDAVVVAVVAAARPFA